MVSFEKIQLSDDTPIYLQLVRHVKREIAAGGCTDGEEMPSRRVLSALLGVNPNTVQKAYRMLEEEGLIESRAGAKSYIKTTGLRQEELLSELLQAELRQTVRAVKALHITGQEAAELFLQIWEEEYDNDSRA